VLAATNGVGLPRHHHRFDLGIALDLGAVAVLVLAAAHVVLR
jgi:hypothetical protein